MNLSLTREYIVDDQGNKTKVIIDYNDFLKLIEIIKDKIDSELIKKTIDEDEVNFDDYKRLKKIV